MNINTDSQNPMPVFHGNIQTTVYRKQLVGRYEGNPLIEALPPILSTPDAAKLLAYSPKREPNSHKLPPEIRTHLVMDAIHFFEPLPVHLDLEQRISRVIRDSYVGRNPLAKDHWQDLDQRIESIAKAGGIPLRSSNVNGFSIIGIPGIGKTIGVERILQLYPQQIRHSSYDGKSFSRIQLVWLKLTCPHDGSIKGLCLDFFREVDGVVGTDYYRIYANGGRRTVDELIPAMSRVAWVHGLGMLVIDEIQHLNQAKSGGAERMLNFFLQLMNTLGLPVLLIGTYAALQILSRELRQIRRSSGQGDLIWDRMLNDETWQFFAESLMRFQYTNHPVPLNQELSDALHEESAGIVDFAVKIFLLAQLRAIANGTEKITPAIIRSVAKDSFRLAQSALQAIRTGDMRAVSMMTDLHPIDFKSAAHDIRKASLLQELTHGSRMASDLNAAAAQLAKSRSDPPDGAVNETPPPKQVKTRRQKNDGTGSHCLLNQIVDKGTAKNVSAHDALVQAGLVGPIFNFNGTTAH